MARVRFPAARSALAAFALLAATSGCGGATEVRTVTRTVEPEPAQQTANVATTPSVAPEPAAPKPTAPKPRRQAFVACDANVKAKAETTTCAFAQNTFYEY